MVQTCKLNFIYVMNMNVREILSCIQGTKALSSSVSCIDLISNNVRAYVEFKVFNCSSVGTFTIIHICPFFSLRKCWHFKMVINDVSYSCYSLFGSEFKGFRQPNNMASKCNLMAVISSCLISLLWKFLFAGWMN